MRPRAGSAAASAAGVLVVAACALGPGASPARAAQQPSGAAAPAAMQETDGLTGWIDALEAGLAEVEAAAAAGERERANAVALRLYLDRYERIEAYYGPGGEYASPPLAEVVAALERRFHELLAETDATELSATARAVRAELPELREAARTAGVPLRPAGIDVADLAASTPEPSPGAASAPEIRAMLDELADAEAAYRAGDPATALARVEHAYLERFEPIEPRLPSDGVGRVERLIHLGLRPQIADGAPAADVHATFGAVRRELLSLDEALSTPSPFWFGAANAFAIILREGLEAVLLVGALLAYLGASGAERRHRRQIYAGVALGVAASFATWFVARTLIPIGGASRELIEGITALIAVGVLLYVSHWLFRKSYIHDWKRYLQENVGRAISGGSAFAMAGLAFAAVYREGFETVLFYQALLFDTGPTAVLTGFAPGLVLILGLGFGIIRLGLRLPLKKVFAATNALLLYLAFVFLGKGIYNLQEAGLFAPNPLAWMPDSGALRQLFGFYPLTETLLAQAIFLSLLAATYLFYRRRIAA